MYLTFLLMALNSSEIPATEAAKACGVTIRKCQSQELLVYDHV